MTDHDPVRAAAARGLELQATWVTALARDGVLQPKLAAAAAATLCTLARAALHGGATLRWVWQQALATLTHLVETPAESCGLGWWSGGPDAFEPVDHASAPLAGDGTCRCGRCASCRMFLSTSSVATKIAGRDGRVVGWFLPTAIAAGEDKSPAVEAGAAAARGGRARKTPKRANAQPD